MGVRTSHIFCFAITIVSFFMMITQLLYYHCNEERNYFMTTLVVKDELYRTALEKPNLPRDEPQRVFIEDVENACIRNWFVGSKELASSPWKTNSSATITRCGVMVGDFSKWHNKRTILTIGNAQGGTSLIAGLIRMIGIYSGPESELGLNHEYPPIVSGNLSQIQAIIKKFNSQHSVWATKVPFEASKTFFSSPVIASFRHPILILPLRDAISISRRWANPVFEDRTGEFKNNIPIDPNVFFFQTEQVMQNQREMIEKSKQLQIPTFYLSETQMIKNPLECIEDLEVFVGRKYHSIDEPVELATTSYYTRFCPRREE
jgi:hypothetical protein